MPFTQVSPPFLSQSQFFGAINLTGSSAGAVKTATFAADQVVVGTALNGTLFSIASFSSSFNGNNTGANGMDIGAMPTNNNLYIYAIYNPTTQTSASLGTTSGTGSTIYPGSNMPSGYTASSLIWSGVTTSTNFMQFNQIGREIYMAQKQLLSLVAGVASLTSLSCSSAVPPNTKFINGLIQQVQASSTVQQVEIASDSVGIVGKFSASFYPSATAVASKVITLNFRIPVTTTQTVYWITNNTTASSVDCYIRGYTI